MVAQHGPNSSLRVDRQLWFGRRTRSRPCILASHPRSTEATRGDSMNVNTARLRYHGTGGSFFGLVLGNALLTLITVGVYSFWAKNKVREFHYSHTELDGDRFAYHGTGGELFSGYLKAMGVMLVLALVLGLASALFAGPS